MGGSLVLHHNWRQATQHSTHLNYVQLLLMASKKEHKLLCGGCCLYAA
jgi:hypothetical protein